MAKRGTWRERLDILETNVGRGTLVGGYSVNQRYAAVQHVRKDYKHPRGGGPDYVSAPLAYRFTSWYQAIADHLLRGGAADRMADAMEDLDHQVTVLAPLDLNNLRQSGHPTVTDDGAPHYDRPPRVPRLPEGGRGRR